MIMMNFNTFELYNFTDIIKCYKFVITDSQCFLLDLSRN